MHAMLWIGAWFAVAGVLAPLVGAMLRDRGSVR